MVHILEASGFILKTTVVEMDRLKLHEEIIPTLLQDLVNSIESDGFLMHPVIVDEKTFVVLDGMHRVEALKELNCKLVPVCLVNYRDKRLKLSGWDRLFLDVRLRSVLELCKKAGFDIKKSQFQKAKKIHEDGEPEPALISVEECYMLEGGEDLPETYRMCNKVESALRKKNIEVNAETREDILQKIEMRGNVGLLLPPPTKEDVINTALSGSVLPYKTTRHVVPSRPMNVRIPLNWLKDRKKLKDVDERLTRSLENRKLERLPPRNMFEGRRYEEELYIFK